MMAARRNFDDLLEDLARAVDAAAELVALGQDLGGRTSASPRRRGSGGTPRRHRDEASEGRRIRSRQHATRSGALAAGS